MKDFYAENKGPTPTNAEHSPTPTAHSLLVFCCSLLVMLARLSKTAADEKHSSQAHAASGPTENFSENTDSPTVHHRLESDGSLTLVLVYVDDLIVYSQDPQVAKGLYSKLSKIYKMKQTGILEPGKRGQLEFLGRIIVRTTECGPVFFGLKPGYLKSLGEEFGIGEKGTKVEFS